MITKSIKLEVYTYLWEHTVDETLQFFGGGKRTIDTGNGAEWGWQELAVLKIDQEYAKRDGVVSEQDKRARDLLVE